MLNLQYAVWRKETGDAGGKAKNDAFDIAYGMGFEASYRPSSFRIMRIIQQYLSMNRFDSADNVFVQYPAVDPRMMQSLFKHLKRTTNSIALVHDMRMIQGVGRATKYDEIDYLNHFSHVIAHNKQMAGYLMKNGYNGDLVLLNLFDYLHDVRKPIQNPNHDGSVAYAGNLCKSKFIHKLNQINGVHFLLYGNYGNEQPLDNINVQYMGMLPSNEIVYKLKGDYGLVWDGNSTDSCSGANGEYLRYNSPHKLSLYIAAGKPVITWRMAAIADFIIKNDIGLVIDSLSELSSLDLVTNYSRQRANLMEIKRKIAQGGYLSTAISRCL